MIVFWGSGGKRKMIARFRCFTENLTGKTCKTHFGFCFKKCELFEFVMHFCCFSEHLKWVNQNKTRNSEHYSFKYNLERKTTNISLMMRKSNDFFIRKCKMIVSWECPSQNPVKWSSTKMIGGARKSLEPTKMIDHFSGKLLYNHLSHKCNKIRIYLTDTTSIFG